jgi:hypothetical protein
MTRNLFGFVHTSVRSHVQRSPRCSLCSEDYTACYHKRLLTLFITGVVQFKVSDLISRETRLKNIPTYMPVSSHLQFVICKYFDRELEANNVFL